MARAEMVANLPTVRDLFAKRDRERLLAECGPMFEIQKTKYGVDQMQFHLPTAVSFLRLHAPTQHGDDLSKFRPMVVAVNADRVARKGMVIARTGPAIFGVVPMADLAGGPAGSLDVGMDFNPILDGLKATYQLELALFIAEEPLRKFATGLPGEVLTEENRRGKFIKFHSTHWALMKDLATEADVMNVAEDGFTRKLRGITYGALVLPLRDPAGEPLGLLAVAKDFSASRAASGRSLVWQSLLALFAIVTLAVAILVVIRGFLLRPMQMITERFAVSRRRRSVAGDRAAGDALPGDAGSGRHLRAAQDTGREREMTAKSARALDPVERCSRHVPRAARGHGLFGAGSVVAARRRSAGHRSHRSSLRADRGRR